MSDPRAPAQRADELVERVHPRHVGVLRSDPVGRAPAFRQCRRSWSLARPDLLRRSPIPGSFSLPWRLDRRTWGGGGNRSAGSRHRFGADGEYQPPRAHAARIIRALEASDVRHRSACKGRPAAPITKARKISPGHAPIIDAGHATRSCRRGSATQSRLADIGPLIA